MNIRLIVILIVNVTSLHLSLNNNADERVYLFSNQSGNLIWSGAMNLAWNQLKNNFIKENIKLETNDAITLKSLNALNGDVLSKDDFKEKDYYIKAGYGQQTVILINQQLIQKFPENSFGSLQLQLRPIDIVSLAYFMKKIKYLSKFNVQQNFNFNGNFVKGFTAFGQDQHQNINLHNYENDDNFLISLKLTQNDTQLFLYKSNKIFQTFSTISKLIQNTKDNGTCIQKNDRFGAPQIHFDFQRQYYQMLNKKITNTNLQNYTITKMFQKIKFDMDNQGVKIQNLGVIAMRAGSAPNSHFVQPKKLILDKPYWIVMKNRDKRPFFITYINTIK